MSKKQSVMERVKTFADACNETGENENDEKFLTGTTDEIAYKKLKVVAKALNEGKELSFHNYEPKYYPWFTSTGSGFRFDATGYVHTVTDAAGGSRLCYATRELAEYAGKQFIELYNQSLN